MYFYDDFEMMGCSSCSCDSQCFDTPPSESNPTGCTNCDS